MDSAKRLATYEDLFALPDGTRAEIIDGVIVTPPSPLPRHANVQRVLGRFIGGPFHDDDGYGGPGGWWIFPEVDVRFALHMVLRPDLAGWRRERCPDPWATRPIDVVPDWVCEVISPSDPAADRVRKRRIYADHGVPYYWIVDPEARTLEALRLEPATKLWMEVGTYTDDATVGIAPFEVVPLEVGRLFPPVVARGPA